jgi:hypothetical protein
MRCATDLVVNRRNCPELYRRSRNQHSRRVAYLSGASRAVAAGRLQQAQR